MPTITPAVLPPLEGDLIDSLGDYRYRLYTVAELPFDALPAYPAGPARVAHTDWHTATSSLCHGLSSPSVVAADDGMVAVRATRGGYNKDGQYDPALVERHELDGQRFATQHAADRAVYEAGLTAFMVYERDAARFGLPIAEAV
jgi:hypothetical protein